MSKRKEIETNTSIERIINTIYKPINPRKLETQKTMFDFPEKKVQVKPSKKKTYSQDWPAYDMAKTNEDILFKKLLDELLTVAIDENPIPKRGRKAYGLKDRIFAMCIKAYYTCDLRKCNSMLKEQKELHYISKVPCFKSISTFFNDKALIHLLDDLILISALPLASLETTGAIDSTGVSTSKFETWNEFKWGKEEGKSRVWRKVHVFAGCHTNIIVSIKLTEGSVADISMVERVIGKTPNYFNMDTFVADKAYSSRPVLEFMGCLGLVPYIPFKKNVTGKARGSSLWRKMFLEFKQNNEKFMERYHQRSKIETVMFMLKQKFGNNLFTKSFEANEVEIKIKALCHNLRCLIQEAFESHIFVDFVPCVVKVRPV